MTANSPPIDDVLVTGETKAYDTSTNPGGAPPTQPTPQLAPVLGPNRQVPSSASNNPEIHNGASTREKLSDWFDNRKNRHRAGVAALAIVATGALTVSTMRGGEDGSSPRPTIGSDIDSPGDYEQSTTTTVTTRVTEQQISIGEGMTDSSKSEPSSTTANGGLNTSSPTSKPESSTNSMETQPDSTTTSTGSSTTTENPETTATTVESGDTTTSTSMESTTSTSEAPGTTVTDTTEGGIEIGVEIPGITVLG